MQDLFVRSFSFQNLWLMKQARRHLMRRSAHVDGEEHISEKNPSTERSMGMVSALKDPYTRFVDPDELKEEEIDPGRVWRLGDLHRPGRREDPGRGAP